MATNEINSEVTLAYPGGKFVFFLGKFWVSSVAWLSTIFGVQIFAWSSRRQHPCVRGAMGEGVPKGTYTILPKISGSQFPIGQDLVTWPHLAARKAGKCSLPCRQLCVCPTSMVLTPGLRPESILGASYREQRGSHWERGFIISQEGKIASGGKFFF